jgi:pyruvate/2-oxoglutarate dehydrogenase complex dihydrolipoamide acyltransferase (E2) component
MIGYNPIYEYAALPDTPRIIEALRRVLATSVERGGYAAPSAAPFAPPPPAASVSASDPAHAPVNSVVPGTSDISVKVPIMGEGLRSARVVALHKQAGDKVSHDDVLCEVETDKAVYPIEASFSGTFKAWKIKADDTVEIGQEIAIVAGDAASVATMAAPVVPAAHPGPQQLQASRSESVAGQPAAAPGPAGERRDPALPAAITRRLDHVVPANMEMDVRYAALRAAREQAKKELGKAAPSPSAMMAWGVVRAMEKHAGFRRIVTKDGTILEQKDFELGVAVALEGDRLGTAVVRRSNRLDWTGFTAAYAAAVESTRTGKIEDVQAPVNLTSLGAFGIEKAWPIVVPPAMSTLFVGTAHERMINDGGVVYPVEVVTLSITFDHRVVNGAGAAAFLQELKAQFENFRLPG